MRTNARNPLCALAIGAFLATLACEGQGGGPAAGQPGVKTYTPPPASAIYPVSPSVEVGYLPLQLVLQTRNADGSTSQTTQATWSSDTPAVATVSDTGLVSPVSAGTAVITASLAGFPDATTTIKVAPQIVELQLVPTNPDVTKDLSKTLHVVAIYADHTSKDVSHDAAIVPTDPTVAKVVGTTVTGVGAGTSTMFADYHLKRASNTVKVTARKVTSLTVTGPASLAQGTTGAFKAVATFDDGSHLTVTRLSKWTTVDPTIATVGIGNGVVTPVGEGTTKVNVEFTQGTGAGATTVTGSADVAVKAATVVASKVDILDPNGAVITTLTMPLESFVDVSAQATFSDGSTQDVTNDAAWSSANTDTADENLHADVSGGEITTISPWYAPNNYVASPGTVDVLADLGTGADAQEGKVTVTVSDTAKLTGVTLALDPASPIAVGDQTSITATGNWSVLANWHDDWTGRVTFVSSDPTVLVVDDSGTATQGVATGLKAGTVTVDAYANVLDPVAGTYAITKVGSVSVTVQ